jgi:2-polyprenyl-6-methoxyphenol hydroxylase-like FAD-dependent oxidoreductase
MSSDAAHLALPFPGEGATLAMYDGAELSKAITASLGDTEAALLAYKRTLFLPAHLLLWRWIGTSSCVSARTRLKVNSACSPITSPSNNCLTKREKSA